MNKPTLSRVLTILSALLCIANWVWFFANLPVFSSASHGPVGGFGIAWIFTVSLGVALGLAQLGCVILALRGKWDSFRKFAIAGFLGAYCFQLLWATDLFFVARLYCSSYSLSALVDEVQRSATQAAAPRRVGLFTVEKIRIEKDHSVYFVTELYPESEYGIAWSSGDTDHAGSQERVFSHWYKFYRSVK
jgi:hypothetical protein